MGQRPVITPRSATSPARQDPAERELGEETLEGLRFARNQIGGQADLAESITLGESGTGAGDGHITG